MAYPPRAIKVVTTLAVLRQMPGPFIPEYVFVLETGTVLRFAPGSTLDDDGYSVIATNGQAGAGAWILQRIDDKGADLTGDATQTLTVGGKRWRRIPTGTLTQNITLTCSAINAAAGDWFEITREDTSGFTVTIANGGAGGGNVITLGASQKACAVPWFDGTNWIHRRSHAML
jgi:hypothetical protein